MSNIEFLVKAASKLFPNTNTFCRSLIPMADVSGTDENIKMVVAKLLTFMYTVSPVMAFIVMLALRTSQQAIES